MNPEIKLKINGLTYKLRVTPEKTLIDVLRDQLGLIGTKKGCNEGNGGAWTVLIDGLPMCSCLLLAVGLQNNEITTIEGSKMDEDIQIIQKAFVEVGAIQCGFCSPGMILSTKGLLDKNPNPSVYEIKEAFSGNICRCTGYKKIIKAIQTASFQINEKKSL
ncbi:MAG: (2Fe-2S)-binding protein [Chloroflexi bacterium]|nr:(2Fe-2S)-binding protein [Chloroflexota bacterium]